MLERLIEEYADRGYQYAYHLCGNVDEAQELVQEAFYKVIRGWDKFDQSQDFGNWFISILHNIHVDNGRKRGRIVSLDVPVDSGAGEESQAYADVLADGDSQNLLDRLERTQGQDEVRAAFDTLSEDAKAILTLCDIQGLSYDEISRVMDVPAGTVRSRIFRARAALRRAVSASAAEEVLE